MSPSDPCRLATDEMSDMGEDEDGFSLVASGEKSPNEASIPPLLSSEAGTEANADGGDESEERSTKDSPSHEAEFQGSPSSNPLSLSAALSDADPPSSTPTKAPVPEHCSESATPSTPPHRAEQSPAIGPKTPCPGLVSAQGRGGNSPATAKLVPQLSTAAAPGMLFSIKAWFRNPDDIEGLKTCGAVVTFIPLILLMSVGLAYAFVAFCEWKWSVSEPRPPRIFVHQYPALTHNLLKDVHSMLAKQQATIDALHDALRAVQQAQGDATAGLGPGDVEAAVVRGVTAALASVDLGQTTCNMESEWLACETASQRMEAQMLRMEDQTLQLQSQLGQCERRLQASVGELTHLRSATHTTSPAPESPVPTPQPSTPQDAPAPTKRRGPVTVRTLQKPQSAHEADVTPNGTKASQAQAMGDTAHAMGRRGPAGRNKTSTKRSMGGAQAYKGDAARASLQGALAAATDTLRAAGDAAAAAARVAGGHAGVAMGHAERASRQVIDAVQSQLSTSAEQLSELQKTLSGPVLQQIKTQWESVQAAAQADAQVVHGKVRDAAQAAHARLKDAKQSTKKRLRPVEKLMKKWLKHSAARAA